VARCFYCSAPFSGTSPPEHVLPAAINADLVTGRVCGPCNRRAGVEVDQPWLNGYFVKEARVRHQIPDRRGNPPSRMSIPSGPAIGPPEAIVHLDGVSGTTTFMRVPKDEIEDDRITMRGYAAEALAKKIARLEREHPDFKVIAQHEEPDSGGQVTVTMVQDGSHWPRFAAKTALATASLVAPDDWLDTQYADDLQKVLWNGPSAGATAEPGWGWCGVPLELRSASPLKPPEHLLAFEAGGFAIIVFGELLYRIRDFVWEWSGGESSSWPQSWWLSPDEPKGRMLPTQVQYGFLSMRSDNA
jgi:hypothetical protein